ncbi:hypothetical protein FNF31_04533 [Cafeteria roenbergensis]|uniref:Phosphatidic acid phosphatase type 2/haloperoxidase domain-containing protein n=1 Tax=Cafeteria roenbergensis TaxID=33653 RepID=A0A5A8D4G0_CAFRO|nr:hypothetical protein FNF31_04533 [Cafeteria roenbergensis]
MPASCGPTDAVVIAALLAVFGALTLGAIPTLEREFFIDDPAISYPLKPESVTTAELLIVSIIIPVLAVLVCDVILPPAGRPIKFLVSRIAWLLLGAVVTGVVSDIGKHVAGRLRPDWLARCQPDPIKVAAALEAHVRAYAVRGAANSSVLEQTPLRAVEVCGASLDSPKLIDGRHSFPSGHASFSAFSGVVTALYLQQALHVPSQGSPSLVPFLQLLAITWPIVVGLTRFSDDYHNGTDILAGFVVGAAVAAFVHCRLMQPRQRARAKPDADDSSDESEVGEVCLPADAAAPDLAGGGGTAAGAGSSSSRRRRAPRPLAAARPGQATLAAYTPSIVAIADGFAWEASRCGRVCLVRSLTREEQQELDAPLLWCCTAEPRPSQASPVPGVNPIASAAECGRRDASSEASGEV